MTIHSPLSERIRTPSMTVPFFPSITSGPDAASEAAGNDVVVPGGVGLVVGVLGGAVGTLVALGELAVLGVGAMLDGGVVIDRVGIPVVVFGRAGKTVKAAEIERVRPVANRTAALIS